LKDCLLSVTECSKHVNYMYTVSQKMSLFVLL